MNPVPTKFLNSQEILEDCSKTPLRIYHYFGRNVQKSPVGYKEVKIISHPGGRGALFRSHSFPFRYRSNFLKVYFFVIFSFRYRTFFSNRVFFQTYFQIYKLFVKICYLSNLLCTEVVFVSFRYISVFFLKFLKFFFFKISLNTEVSWTGPGRCGAIGQSYRRHSSEIKF